MKINVPFNVSPLTKTKDEIKLVTEVIRAGHLKGDGLFSKKIQSTFKLRTKSASTLFVPSCTAGLEMAALLCDIKPGDEVIMPSYTFVSTANAFVLQGAKIKFIDIRPDTLNINESLIEEAITPKTKAIVPVHYAGVSCDMDKIMEIAKKYELFVVEDAAHGVMSTYKGKALGSIGDFGAFSFHETKNYTSGGEGGLLLVKDKAYTGRAEILREKGTNRAQFLKGAVDKYTWVDKGSSYLPSELQAAYLFAQTSHFEIINEERLKLWSNYQEAFCGNENLITATIPEGCAHNAHMFYLILEDEQKRDALIQHLKVNNIIGTSHYVPLHSSPAGKKFGEFKGDDLYTTSLSSRLIRLPLFYGLTAQQQQWVIESVDSFFKVSKNKKAA
ncbi:MAG: dTDP-4-amino-4,6-dideoxygalactose transaminase [Halobacteriovoraceae bacterium]|nr:dTDP-4-amino-4,6-dideoxygalactose transaminase [Halobacteriovoraceae bacterium]|tara:strand:+ start:143 stop:1303 length:1161 start_codon:yes stop_codon:yes gene_type:complete